ncbi:MAG: DUF333 domain-containing protein [Deltaproteobacteria bacterium]|nr:DUF333 domain-containing protein [Deltaproteobacteria bacterium]
MSALLLFLLSAAFAEPPKPAQQKYRIHGQWVEFIRDEKRHLTLSAACRKQKCLAYKALAKSSLAGLDEKLEGGAQPGAVICRQQFHGDLQVGQDEDGNETGFCKFKDGSLVGTGSISYYASRPGK